MEEGTVVVVTDKLDTRVRGNDESLVIGTIVGFTKDKKVQILLPNGLIHITETYNITPHSTQV